MSFPGGELRAAPAGPAGLGQGGLGTRGTPPSWGGVMGCPKSVLGKKGGFGEDSDIPKAQVSLFVVPGEHMGAHQAGSGVGVGEGEGGGRGWGTVGLGQQFRAQTGWEVQGGVGGGATPHGGLGGPKGRRTGLGHRRVPARQ